MKIAVLVKWVPNRGGDPPEIADDSFRLRRDQPEAGLDPADEPSVEKAVQIVEREGGQVTVVSMGPEGALPAVRRALAMGANDAVLVSDVRLTGADVLATAKVIAAALRRGSYDLVITGVESTDAATGTLPMTVAALLGLPSVTFARQLSVSSSSLIAERQTPNGHDVVECPLPALVAVTVAVAEPRYPSIRDTIKAKSKTIERLTLDDLGLNADDVRATHSIESVELAPEREAGDLVEDLDEGVRRIIEMLRESKAM